MSQTNPNGGATQPPVDYEARGANSQVIGVAVAIVLGAGSLFLQIVQQDDDLDKQSESITVQQESITQQQDALQLQLARDYERECVAALSTLLGAVAEWRISDKVWTYKTIARSERVQRLADAQAGLNSARQLVLADCADSIPADDQPPKVKRFPADDEPELTEKGKSTYITKVQAWAKDLREDLLK